MNRLPRPGSHSRVSLICLAFLVVTALGGQACYPSLAGKDKCRNDGDCLLDHRCNLDPQSTLGRCMATTSAGLFRCSTLSPCSSGQICVNGICATGCNSNADCPETQYCDNGSAHSTNKCIDKKVSTCASNGQCAEYQQCSKGMCVAKPTEEERQQAEACTVTSTSVGTSATASSSAVSTGASADQCNQFSVCIEGSDNTGAANAFCSAFPGCPQDGLCPPNSVCNEGYWPDKGRMCLPGFCVTNANCESGYECKMQGVLSFSAALGLCMLGMPQGV